MAIYESLKGKNVLITGGTSGIGAATVKLFAEQGANVAVVGRNIERGEAVTKEASQNGTSRCCFFLCDVSDYEEVKALREAYFKEYETIDVLVNNAGVFMTESLEELVEEDWSTSFRINVDGAMHMTKTFIADLKRSRGCVINNASVSGLDSFTSGTKNYMYGASKAALVKFSKLCALNYAETLRVNVVCPGIVDTEIFTNRDFSRFDGVIPNGHIAKPEQVGQLILFLASEEASYITGAVIPVDGGMSLK